MYRVDIQNKRLIEMPVTSFLAMNLRERFDIQEWIEGTPTILGEELLIIAKEMVLPSGRRLDLLAVDKQGALVVIELKRDDSGTDVEWQAIKYASYCSSFSADEIFIYYAQYLGSDADDARAAIEQFIDGELADLNQTQRIILVSKEFHSEVISAVLWLRESQIDVECIRLRPHRDQDGHLYINPEIIIPLPEAKDYIRKKETRQQQQRTSERISTFSLEKSNLSDDELRARLIESLSRPSDLTPRFRVFLEIIVEEDRQYGREEVKKGLYRAGIGRDLSQAGRYLSNISQYLTKTSTPHLRQVIEFDLGGTAGETKNNYRVVREYRDLVATALAETANGPAKIESETILRPVEEIDHMPAEVFVAS